MDYQENLKKLLSNASEEAQQIVAATMKIEQSRRWQEEHKGLTKEIIKEISRSVSEIVK